jgi:hypothetical protein
VRDSVRHLSKGVAIYGAGDAAMQVVNVLLLFAYVKGKYLVQEDYGALALIGGFEQIAKIVSRWGLDGAFMGPSTIATNTALPQLTSTTMVHARGRRRDLRQPVADVGAIGARLSASDLCFAFRIMIVNTFLISLTFVPFHTMLAQPGRRLRAGVCAIGRDDRGADSPRHRLALVWPAGFAADPS